MMSFKEMQDRAWRKSCIYIKHDKYTAMADFITTRYGLEVPFEIELPKARFLADTMPKRPISEKYQNEGGSEWPDRWLIEAA